MDPSNPQNDPFEPGGARVTHEFESRLRPVKGASRMRLPAALPLAIAGILAVGGIAFGASVVVPQLTASPTPVVVADETLPPVTVGDETQPPTGAPALPSLPVEEPKTDPTKEPVQEPSKPAATPGRLVLSLTLSQGRVKLYWTAFQGEGFSYYKIVRSSDGSATWPPEDGDTLVAAISERSTTSYFDAAAKGKTWSYAVYAVGDGDGGLAVLAASPVKTIAVPAATQAPAPTEKPSGPVALGAITATKDAEGCYTLSWKGFDGVDFSYWKLVHGAWGTQPYYPKFPYWAVLDPGTTSWHGCIDPGDYAVRAQAIHYPDGEPVAAAQTSILHLVVAGDSPTIAPTANLGNLTVTPKGGRCYTLSWKGFDGVDFSYWKVVHGAWGTQPYYPEFPYWAALDPSTTSWTGCLDPGDYAVRVQAIYYPRGAAVAAAQTSIYHLIVAAASPTPPPSPVNLPASFELVPDGVRVSWTAYAGDGFQYYKIVRSETNTSPTFPENAGTSLVAAFSTKATTTWVDTETAAGHTYYYRVLAMRSDGAWQVLAKSSVLKVVAS